MKEKREEECEGASGKDVIREDMRTAGRTILRRRQNERNITRDRKSETDKCSAN